MDQSVSTETQTDFVRTLDAEHRMVLSDTAASALELMTRDDLPFIPVVAPETEKLLGVVLRKAIENGCARMGHTLSNCQLRNHFKSGVATCAEGDEPDPDDAEAFGRKRPFVVVIADGSVPVGFVEQDA